jgi:hypothetical protein
MHKCDAMLIGRGIYEDLSWRWPGQTGDFADAINDIRKYVFSSTLEESDWHNSVIVRGDVVDEVTKLKEEDGKGLVLFGYGELGNTLLEHGLLDELRVESNRHGSRSIAPAARSSPSFTHEHWMWSIRPCRASWAKACTARLSRTVGPGRAMPAR